MAILCWMHTVYGDKLINGVREQLPDEDVRNYPDIGDPNDIEACIVFRMPPGFLKQFPNLKLISTTGAGIDHYLLDPDLPRSVPLVRIVDADFGARMADYVTSWVLFYHREIAHFMESQRRHEWAYKPIRSASEVIVGVMGLGQMGSVSASRLAALGYTVRGWSRGRHFMDGVKCYAGPDEFDEFLSGTEILVNLLPLTAETKNILSRDTFAKLPKGAVVISAGRGGHLNEQDLSEALADGTLRAATIDAFPKEPLPKDHPFWANPKVYVTPHCSSTPTPETIYNTFAENVRRFRAKKPLLNLVDYAKGY